MNPPNTIDVSQLNEFKRDNLEGSPKMYASILSIFLDDTPKMIASIHQLISDGKPAEAKGPAHNLKSNSAALGAQKLSVLAKNIEAAAVNNQINEVKSLSVELSTEFDSIRPFYECELSQANAQSQ